MVIKTLTHFTDVGAEERRNLPRVMKLRTKTVTVVLLFHRSPWITLPCKNTHAVSLCPTRAGKPLEVQLCVEKD